ARSRNAAMTSVPLMLVSSRSRTTTSGLCCSTSLTTSVPSVVQAATLMSGSPSSSARRPSITIAWSSASSTRIMVRASFGGQRDGERRASAGRALECERAAEHLHAILNAAQPEVSPLHAHVLFARELERPHRLAGALRGGRVRRERALEHLELRQGGENVLYRPVVHVQHDALQLALTGREQAPRGGASLGVPNLGHPRPGGSARWIRSATNPSAAPIARAAATRTPPSTVTARRPMATPPPANAPAV